MNNFIKINQEYTKRGEILTEDKYFYDISKLISPKKLIYSDMKKFLVKNYKNWINLKTKFDNYFDQNFVTDHIKKIQLVKVDIN